MPIVRFQSTVWNAPARQGLFRYVRARLMLNVPARYRIGPGAGQEWSVFSDTRLDLDQLAALGALAAFDLDPSAPAMLRSSRRRWPGLPMSP